MTKTDIIDVPDYLGRFGNDEETCLDILKFAQKDCAKHLANLLFALDASNKDDLAFIAHTIKGMGANISAYRLKNAAKDFEEKLKTNQVYDIEAGVVVAELERVQLNLEGVHSFKTDEFAKHVQTISTHDLTLLMERCLAAISLRKPQMIDDVVKEFDLPSLPHECRDKMKKILLLIDEFDYTSAENALKDLLENTPRD